jgi:branched-chain amino acid transport system substrate-binding protein
VGEEVNAKGGLLGRKVELTSYDDQSNPANTPGIYTKLLDVDKVDLLVAPYATVPTAPIMPLVKQRKKLLMGNFSFRVNAKVQHDMWFNNAPWANAEGWSEGFLEVGRSAGAKTIALLAADQEFAQNLADGARSIIARTGLNKVYDQNYPPTTTDFSSIIRAIRAARPEMVSVASYPDDSTAIVRAVNEIGLGSQVVVFGGAMVGLQSTTIMTNLGSMLNGIVNYNTYAPGMKLPGVDDFFKRYAPKAAEAKVDPLGYYIAPFAYSTGQMLEQAITATKSIEDRALADYLRKHEMQTIVGPVRFDADGERANQRVITVQFKGIKDKDMDQFRSPSAQVIVYPTADANGKPITPYDAARKAN